MTILSKTDKLHNNSLDFTFIDNFYTETTNDIKITIWPEFISSKSSALGDLFIWAYHVRIDNKKESSVQLINRYWRIIDEKGNIQEVSGEGAIGKQPIISPFCSYEYSSGTHLRYPSGIMAGKYQMKEIDSDKIFDVKIPVFSLDIPNVNNIIN